MRTIHIICNAHLDPIWLWPWQAGLDEVLATCRSACDLLDRNKDVIFTRGEAWVYNQVEKVDPELFQRIQDHVKAGRWEIVGGWWIQPDCNCPSGIGFERQIALGKRYFIEKFGHFPEVAYNVDSFGHAATLPERMAEAGQKYYIMMRPGQHEMALPSRLFHWKGFPDGPGITTFRISNYNTVWMHPDYIKSSLSDLPEGIEDTMCFVGVGDHGGGPTQDQVDWIRKNQFAIEGCQLVFSSPSRYFKAIADKMEHVPTVTGELQHHAIGCYSVLREIKTSLHRAENRMRQAEIMSNSGLDPDPKYEEHIHEGWKRICLHQFHDTLGGTCLPSSYPAVMDQLGYASTIADEILQHGLRIKMNKLPADPHQRIVLFNASDTEFKDYVEFEPWLEWRAWQPEWDLLDENNKPVPFQVITNEAANATPSRLLFKIQIPPAEMRVLRIVQNEFKTGKSQGKGVSNLIEEMFPNAVLNLPGNLRIPSIRLDLIEDPTDNWSHDIDRYPEGPVTSAIWNGSAQIDCGPLMTSCIQTGTIGESRLSAEWRVYEDEFIELRLKIHWLEKQKILKMNVAFPEPLERRTDGISGGGLARENNGKERPMQDWSLFEWGEDQKLGVVCPGVFALDATNDRARFTLLRSPIMTHHFPSLGMNPRAVISDQGVHEFKFRFIGGREINSAYLTASAQSLQRPPILADLTRGMPLK